MTTQLMTSPNLGTKFNRSFSVVIYFTTISQSTLQNPADARNHPNPRRFMDRWYCQLYQCWQGNKPVLPLLRWLILIFQRHTIPSFNCLNSIGNAAFHINWRLIDRSKVKFSRIPTTSHVVYAKRTMLVNVQLTCTFFRISFVFLRKKNYCRL